MGKRSPEPAPVGFAVITKPIGAICNLNCAYCFYLKKEDLFPKNHSFRMSDDVLEAYVRQNIESQPLGTAEVNFAWQGGEPTLLGLEFFKTAVRLARRHARHGIRINHSIQTNGTRLDDEWGKFLKKHKFLVGLSIDGPRELHNHYRYDKQGAPAFDEVMGGLKILKRHRVDFNTLTVVQNHNGDHPREIYDFLKSIGSRFLQFVPIVEKENGGVSPRSVNPEQYGIFLNGVFERWLDQGDVGRIFVRDFDATLSLLMGSEPGLCTCAETCGRGVALEHNGDLFSCDHYVEADYRLGNILETTMSDMLDSERQRRFGNDKRDTLPAYCRRCRFLELCNGGCRKDRLINSPEGEPGLNYLCAGFNLFYAHTLPVFMKMARCLHQGRPACDYALIDEATENAPVRSWGTALSPRGERGKD